MYIEAYSKNYVLSFAIALVFVSLTTLASLTHRQNLTKDPARHKWDVVRHTLLWLGEEFIVLF